MTDMETIENKVLRHLAPLVGRKLSIARRAADMRVLNFGNVTVDENRNTSVGEFALHIQCPWRIEGPDGVVTGRSDLWEPADQDGDIDWETWTYDKNENLQDRRIGTLLGGYDSRTRSFTNCTESLIVEGVEADEFGGARISLSGGYRLVVFPSGSVGEDWRLFQPSAQRHFVVSGGRVEESTDEAGQQGNSDGPPSAGR